MGLYGEIEISKKFSETHVFIRRDWHWFLGADGGPDLTQRDTPTQLLRSRSGRSVCLSPNDPLIGQALSRMAEAHMYLGNYDQAVKFAQRAVTNPGTGIWVFSTLLAVLAYAERSTYIEDARTELFNQMPKFTCAYARNNFPATDPGCVEIYIEGLRKAEVPEG